MKLVPSILTANLEEAKQKLTLLTGKVEKIQVDVIDGVFYPVKTLDPLEIFPFKDSLTIDYHLMVENPYVWLEEVAQAHGETAIGHVEIMPKQTEFIKLAHERGLKAGLALDLPTPVAKLEPEALKKAETILLMSVKAGRGGQVYDPVVEVKIKDLLAQRITQELKFKICVDGGVTLELVSKLKLLGVDEVVVGERLFEGNFEENLQKWTKIF